MLNISDRVAKSLLFSFLFVSLAFVFLPLDHIDIIKRVFHAVLDCERYVFSVGCVYLGLLIFGRRKILSITMLCMGFVWLLYSHATLSVVRSLGVDSFEEAAAFDVSEALFWVTTLSEATFSEQQPVVLLFYCLLSVFIALLLRFCFAMQSNGIRLFRFEVVIAASIIFLGFTAPLLISGKLIIKSSKSYLKIKENFNSFDVPKISIDKDPLNLIVYIGESTSALNMGLYGYIRNTTPKLSEIHETDSGLVVFNNVFSTHTHTSQSLLESLSVGFDPEQNHLPIRDRKRVPIIDILVEGGLPVRLYSNQGMAGTWNQASTIIFRRSKNRFSVASKMFGNGDVFLKRPFDGEYLGHLFRDSEFKSSGKNVFFFHSYAGHGPYEKYIPKDFHRPVDDYLHSKSKPSLFGRANVKSNSVDSYDSAIRYIDSNLSYSINKIRALEKPSVLVYFSDHGDAVYAGRGHDSSRFTHEMARVPFLVYFNAAARVAYGDIHTRLKERALSNNVSSLAQLPSTLLEIIGAKVVGNQLQPTILAPIGEDVVVDSIVIRQVGGGVSYVSIDNRCCVDYAVHDGKSHDKADTATEIFSAMEDKSNNRPILCYHRVNSIGTALRASMSLACLETDVMIQADKRVAVFHPPAKDTGLNLEDIVAIAKKHGRFLWLDGKNINTKKSCTVLANKLQEINYKDGFFLVEFPSGSHSNASELGSCAERIKALGYATSYYLPTKLVIACSNSLKLGRFYESEYACMELSRDIELAFKSSLFTDISFDYLGALAVEKTIASKPFKFNSWNVDISEISSVDREKYRMIIVRSRDPNTI